MDKVVESAKDAATTLIPSSAPGLDSQRVLHVEKGFEVGGRLVATAQDVLATGMERGAAKLQPYVSDMFVIAWEARDAILSQAKVKSGAEGIPAQGYEEVCAKLEGKIGELRAAVVGWVDDITRRVVSKGLDIAKGQVALKDAAV